MEMMDHDAEDGYEDANEPTEADLEEFDARIDALAESLLKKRDEAIAHRAASGIERQWREAQRAYEGLDGSQSKTSMLDFATGDSWVGRQGQQQRRSRVVVNIIRGKCETVEGRFTEIQLPSDDRNWGLLTTQVPEAVSVPAQMAGMIAGMQPQGQPGIPGMDQQGVPGQPQQMGQMPQPGMDQQQPAHADPRAAKKADLEKRRSAMEEEIDDQLSECNFNGECRKAIRSAVRIGTGVLKGPSVVKSIRRAWVEQSDGVDSVYVMQSVENLKPASKWVDCWNVYPDPHCGSDAKRGAYIWERDHVLPREIKALDGVPGYSSRQLQKVLRGNPVRTVVTVDKGGSQLTEKTEIERGAPYERWEYHGDIDREDMMAMGCDCPEDDQKTVSACVVFINDRPVKAVRNMLDTGELPYDFFTWVPIEDSPWGLGEPHKIIWQQRIITAAWRAMMDNAADSAGAMIVIGKDVEPEDGTWEITGKKIWIDESEDGDVGKAFAQYQIQSNQQDLQRIIEMALKFIDLESGTPAIAQGEQGAAPQILGAMQLLMQGADTNRRNKVKQWDDQITRPHISRYHHWNMQYNEKSDIKGDFEIDARGTSVLLTKDATAQKLMQVMSLRADPEVSLQVDWGKAIRQLFQALHLDVLKPDEQVEIDRQQMAQQPPPAMPQVEVAKIRAEADAQKTQAQLASEQQIAQLENQTEQMRIKVDTDRDTAFVEAQRERNTNDAQLRMQELQLKREIEILRYSTQQKISLDDAKTQLARDSMKLNVQRELASAANAIKSPQVASPAIEPAGRAPVGEAFQK